MRVMKAIIERLGYSVSSNLIYAEKKDGKFQDNLLVGKFFSYVPDSALYMVDDKPFVAFYETSEDHIPKNIIKAIWNFQVPLFIACLNGEIIAYNGRSIDEKTHDKLIELYKSTTDDSLPEFSFWDISNPNFWGKYERGMSKRKLDDMLLENVQVATDSLKRTSCEPFAVRLVLRLIFVRYLIDRGVDLSYEKLNSNVEVSRSQLLEIVSDKEQLYSLFAHLKECFNGNLFELGVGEKETIDQQSLNILRGLLSGEEELSTGQQTLFPLYDFRIIPVELISNRLPAQPITANIFQ